MTRHSVNVATVLLLCSVTTASAQVAVVSPDAAAPGATALTLAAIPLAAPVPVIDARPLALDASHPPAALAQPATQQRPTLRSGGERLAVGMLAGTGGAALGLLVGGFLAGPLGALICIPLLAATSAAAAMK